MSEASGLSVDGLRVAATDINVEIVSDVSFTVRPSATLGIVSESGCGKTTVAMALLGFARPGTSITAGRVVVAGMGKSGIVCQKIAATLSSTGTPAYFLHPAEALHGDIGLLVAGDVVLIVSNSGETEELVRCLELMKRVGVPIVALTGRTESTLARHADVNVDVSVAREACALDLAPTASTTASLAMGDALAVACYERRGFTAKDFAHRHPGGRLGRKVTEVRELMRQGEAVPLSRTEWRLLAMLAANPGRLMLSEELLEMIWGQEYRGDVQYLRVWVSRLRGKLEQDPANPVIIKTSAGLGYMLEVADASSTSASPTLDSK